ncbi:MAG: hypothetical protein ONB55_22440, partial [candidate division KSB1 bacterium]|nr:hypothetical protein [candidate division KSB1 bacterium]
MVNDVPALYGDGFGCIGQPDDDDAQRFARILRPFGAPTSAQPFKRRARVWRPILVQGFYLSAQYYLLGSAAAYCRGIE